MTSSTQVAEQAVVEVRRERIRPGGKLVGNQPKTCPYCGRSGKARKIDPHVQICHKRPR